MIAASMLPLALALAAACPPRHPHCNCTTQHGDTKYRCDIDGVRFGVDTALNTHARLYCYEGDLTCSILPPLQVWSARPLETLAAWDCLPGTAACASAETEVLELHRPTGEFTSTHLATFRGLKKLLLFEAVNQSSVPTEAMAALESLKDVRINSGHLDLHTLVGSPPNYHLEMLDLGDNEIQSVPEDAFSSFRALQKLLLWGNKIKHLHSGSFRGLANLEVLELSVNPLRELPNTVFSETPKLRQLLMKVHNLSVIRGGAFRELEHFEEIQLLGGSSRLTLENGSFSNLPSLKIVQIDNTEVNHLPADLFSGSRSLTNLTITNAGLLDLPEKLLEDQESLLSLDLRDNLITKLKADQFWPVKKLEFLDLSNNIIEVLPSDMLAGLSRLQHLKVDNNRVRIIRRRAFDGARSLRTLSLGHNRLTDLEDEESKECPFSQLQDLRVLDLSWNRVSGVCDDWRLGLDHIAYIDLTSNRVRHLKKKDLEFMNNTTLNLQRNNIKTIEIDAAPLQTAGTFLLSHNPFICDCNLYNFLAFIRANNADNFKLDFAKCDTPEKNSDLALRSVPLESLTCDLPCPRNCECISQPATSMLLIDCAKCPHEDDFPNPKDYNLTSSKLRLRQYDQFLTLPYHVVSLNVTNTNLTEVPYIPQLQELDLRHNQIQSIPNWLLDLNITLFISNNNLQCQCVNRNEVIDLIDNINKIRDIDEVMCGGSFLNRIDVGHLCDVWWATVIGGTLAAVGIITALAAIIIYRKVNAIKKYMYNRWNINIYEREVDGKTFDVLVSYADVDEKYVVKVLVEQLQNFGYEVCARYKDWDIGDYIPEKACHLVSQSRRVLVLVADGYTRCEASVELLAALEYQARVKKKIVIFAVMKEYVTEPELSSVMAENKCVVMDENFWPQISKYLPKIKMSQRSLNLKYTTNGMIPLNSTKQMNICEKI